jgi:NADPH2:quinone reductase
MTRIWPLAPGDTILVHAAAGGVGLVLVQWAKLLGLNVIGTVSTTAKARLARSFGCDHAVIYGQEDVAKRVREITDGKGVKVVYDSVGKDTFAASLDSLGRRPSRLRRHRIGADPADQAMQLAIKGSLFVTRPALADYIADPAERDALAGELFGHIADGRIDVQINQRYELGAAAQAHRDLEARATTGSSIFVI